MQKYREVIEKLTIKIWITIFFYMYVHLQTLSRIIR